MDLRRVIAITVALATAVGVIRKRRQPQQPDTAGTWHPVDRASRQ
jgi:hypothetical protein